MLNKEIQRLCQNTPRVLALPESRDPRILAASGSLLKSNSCKQVVLFSSADDIFNIAKGNNIELESIADKIRFIENSELEQATREMLFANYAKKGKHLADAELSRLSKAELYQAGYLLAAQKVDAVVAGAVHSTADVIKAGITTVGTKDGVKTVSGSFIMQKEKAVYLFADAAVVVEPTVEQLVDIAVESVATWNETLAPYYGNPVVAFLSFSTKGSAKHKNIEKVEAAARNFSEKFPEVECDGELQFDAAYDKLVGSKKAPSSSIPGRANIFIFPNLDAGNIAYKITQRLAGFNAYGPILQGMKFPYCDLSRGAAVEDIVSTSCIALLKSLRS
ncbi:MAG: phosphotransacetylase [Bdellovibrionota bacterium]